MQLFGRGILTVGSLMLAIALSTAAWSAAGSDPLEGVWLVTSRTTADGETISPAGPGQFIFLNGRYSDVHSTAMGDWPRAAVSFQPTDAEKIAQYDTIIVNSGTYEINGSVLTVRPIIAKSAEFVGGSSTFSFSIVGDTFTLEEQSLVASDGIGPNVGGSITLQRVP